MAAAKYQIRRKCELCGAEFLAKTLDSRYCSRACSKKAYNKRKAEESKRLQQDMLISRIPDGRTTSVYQKLKLFLEFLWNLLLR